MNIFSTTILTIIATSIKLLNAFFIVKLVSIYIGPEGLAKVGQFISLITFLTVVSGGGISYGIIKYVSEYKDNDLKKIKTIQTGSFFVFASCFISFCFIFIFREKLSYLIFAKSGYEYIFIFLSIFQFFMGLNNFFTAIINGFKEIKKLTIVNIMGTITGGLISLLMINIYGFDGIILSFLFSQSFMFLYSFIFCLKINNFKFSYFKPALNKKLSILLVKFSFMALISSLMMPLVQMVTRYFLLNQLSWTEIGYWEGVTKISDAYLILITTALSVYCIPSLSSLVHKNNIIDELKKIYKTIIPLTIFLASLIYMFREIIILILFSNEFFPMKELFFWQLIGDVIRISAIILSYFIISKSLYKTYIFVEVFCALSFIMLIYLLTEKYGINGAIYAFTINSLIHLFLTATYALKEIFTTPQIEINTQNL